MQVLAAGEAGKAQQLPSSTEVGTRKRGRPKTAELQAPAPRQPDTSACNLPTWAAATNPPQRPSAFSHVSRRSDATRLQPQGVSTAAAQAPATEGAAATDDAAAGSHMGVMNVQQHAAGASQNNKDAAGVRNVAADPLRHNQPAAVGQAHADPAMKMGSDHQPGSLANQDNKQGRLFGGFALRGDAEILNRFQEMSTDASKVFFMASKLGLQSDVVERAAARLAQLPGSDV